MLQIDLTGKVALVTGGSRGIGRAVTECLCEAGANTVFTHTGNPERESAVAELVERIRADGGTVEATALDGRDGDEPAALAKRIAAKHGRIDILVHNVGHNVPCAAEDCSDAAWRDGIDTNLGTSFFAVRSVLPYMLAAGHGRIVLIGSSAVCDGGGGAIDYAAAKAGMVGMMKYLNRNYIKRGILTNTIHPCVIETDLLLDRYSSDEQRRQLLAQVPVGRLGRPGDIGGLVAYLVSPWGDFVCDQEILVDGGRTRYGRS